MFPEDEIHPGAWAMNNIARTELGVCLCKGQARLSARSRMRSETGLQHITSRNRRDGGIKARVEGGRRHHKVIRHQQRIHAPEHFF
jgi:hypothetical protein